MRTHRSSIRVLFAAVWLRTAKGGWISLRPEALNEAEELRDTIRKRRDEAKR